MRNQVRVITINTFNNDMKQNGHYANNAKRAPTFFSRAEALPDLAVLHDLMYQYWFHVLFGMPLSCSLT
jgi:hypothetical protein